MKIQESTIELKGLRFYAYHGALPHERKVGNLFLVDLSVSFDATAVMESDDLSCGINYANLFSVVDAEMSVPSLLLEHVAHRILTHIGSDFPTVTRATVSVTKPTPPIQAFHGNGISFTATAIY